MQELAGKQVPMIVIESDVPDVTCICSAWQDSAYAVTKHLLAEGCTQIALVCGENSAAANLQIHGYYSAIEEAGISPETGHILWTTQGVLLDPLLEQQRLDGILLADPAACEYILSVMKNRQIEIPTAYCGRPIRTLAVHWTKYIHDTELIAKEAVRKLILEIELNPKTPERILVQGRMDDHSMQSYCNT